MSAEMSSIGAYSRFDEFNNRQLDIDIRQFLHNKTRPLDKVIKKRRRRGFGHVYV